ncbi:trehalose operon repressor [Tepidibacillus infernus]|uniref:Trehalose operon repressor n=1 Tax=Tepidibacillus decaturensis TaxID=1413211 RepID=A0A135L719_9BACI|nr:MULTISPECIES: trehalose operon repressor [Tepidibacillus]KXG44729.1 GntR family transcriptional regulator [Tepidibacillus decaturensis]GBF11484.1 trehalose operon transcriptional repressor [Tepidibacillus sp. HK-1]
MNKRYIEIYEEIRNAIVERQYSPGEKLPSEHDLCKKYNTSRGTIRRALDLLAEEGLVHSLHGKGVFVLDHDTITFSFGGLVSFKEASVGNGEKFVTTVPKFEEVIIDESLHQKTNLPIGKEAYYIYRIRHLDGERIIFDINYFLKDLIIDLTKEIAEQSIYQYIEEILKLKIGFARRVIQVEPATMRDKQNLDIKGYPFVVVVKNFAHLNDGTQFEYTESHHRPDRFVFSDFARRR